MRISPKILLSIAFALAATQAFAHAQLEKATPPVGGTVSPPSEIRLEFSEGVDLRFSGVTLTAPGAESLRLSAAGAPPGRAIIPRERFCALAKGGRLAVAPAGDDSPGGGAQDAAAGTLAAMAGAKALIAEACP